MADKKKATITVEQIGSPIRRPADQEKTLIGLGLNKMHRTPRPARKESHVLKLNSS